MPPIDMIRAAISAMLLLIAAAALAHEGKLDSDGCHHSEEEGYHCH